MTVVRKMKPGRVVAISIVGILMIVLMAELLWNLAIAPRLIIRKITLESDLGLTDSQILEMLNIEGETWAQVSAVETMDRAGRVHVRLDCRMPRCHYAAQTA